MAVKFDLIEPIKNAEEATKFLAGNFLPIFDEYWEAKGKDYYGARWDIKVVDFTQLWMHGTLTLVLAKDDDKPVGFILGAILRPLLYDTRLLRIETWYIKDRYLEYDMFSYLENGLKFMQVDEIIIPEYMSCSGEKASQLFKPASYRMSTITHTHYVRK